MNMVPQTQAWLAQITGVFQSQSVSLPMTHVLALLVIATAFIAYGKFKWGMLVVCSYLFANVFVLNQDFILNSLGQPNGGVVLYIALGLVIPIVFLLSLFREEKC